MSKSKYDYKEFVSQMYGSSNNSSFLNFNTDYNIHSGNDDSKNNYNINEEKNINFNYDNSNNLDFQSNISKVFNEDDYNNNFRTDIKETENDYSNEITNSQEYTKNYNSEYTYELEEELK